MSYPSGPLPRDSSTKSCNTEHVRPCLKLPTNRRHPNSSDSPSYRPLVRPTVMVKAPTQVCGLCRRRAAPRRARAALELMGSMSEGRDGSVVDSAVRFSGLQIGECKHDLPMATHTPLAIMLSIGPWCMLLHEPAMDEPAPLTARVALLKPPNRVAIGMLVETEGVRVPRLRASRGLLSPAITHSWTGMASVQRVANR
jgi:hypothetical protein